MFTILLLSALSATAFASDPGTPPSNDRPLTELEHRELMRHQAELTGQVTTTRKAVTQARAAAVATGDTATVGKSDAILVRLDDIQRKLDGVARIEHIRGVHEQLDGISRDLASINGQLTALVNAIDALPTSEEVRQIVREELEAAKPVCDYNMPGDSAAGCSHSDDEDEEDEDEDASDRDDSSASDSSGRPPGWLIGAGISVEGRDDYGNVVEYVSVGGHGMIGLTWEDGAGFGTGLLVHGGIATVNSSSIGGELIVYRDGSGVDCGGGLGLENQAYDQFGNSAAAANSFGGTLGGYFRVGDVGSVIFQPYVRVGYFTAGGGVGVPDGGGGLRVTAAFGSR
ncbi:MAG: hypothetical protein NUV56_02115 [Candidatus Uhrbacteria bacterium]|nr:hypothetical protein [Candidatus Uhrbacteria bacterium]